ncbi:MAG: type III pantothenate kinase [Desulfovibrio sp.]|uniref:type III pantothenate kinase n=1 Tax=Desulfovibrio sp. TaxID=885 RepID=UPI001A709602|nr:type III pantothenate kinase [Desulfovibrio sp.]MBD5417015.1 type III pantothenate kinase [Desulfovibrio sp.]
MQAELLLFDVGNTSIKVGMADESHVLAAYTLPAATGQTADSLGLTLLSLLGHAGVAPASLKACVASSVVPPLDPLLAEAVARFVGRPLLRAVDDLPVPLENRYERPAEVGADRLVAAYAARRQFPEAASLVVADFGTALTLDCVSGEAYLGGLIFPGPATAMAALSSHAAKLPPVSMDVSAEEPTPGRDTVTSIRHGLFFGYVSISEGLTGRLGRQMPGPVTTVATGGFAAAIAQASPVFDAVLPQLLLEGLRRLYYEDQACDASKSGPAGKKEEP